MKEQKGIIKSLNQIAAVFEKILNIFIGIFVGILGLSVFIGYWDVILIYRWYGWTRSVRIAVYGLHFLGLLWPADMECCPT